MLGAEALQQVAGHMRSEAGHNARPQHLRAEPMLRDASPHLGEVFLHFQGRTRRGSSSRGSRSSGGRSGRRVVRAQFIGHDQASIGDRAFSSTRTRVRPAFRARSMARVSGSPSALAGMPDRRRNHEVLAEQLLVLEQRRGAICYSHTVRRMPHRPETRISTDAPLSRLCARAQRPVVIQAVDPSSRT